MHVCDLCLLFRFRILSLCPHCFISPSLAPRHTRVKGVRASACVVWFQSTANRCSMSLVALCFCVSAARTPARSFFHVRPAQHTNIALSPALTPLTPTGASLHAKSLFVPSLLVSPPLLDHITWSTWPPPRRRQCGLLPGPRIGALRSTRWGR